MFWGAIWQNGFRGGLFGERHVGEGYLTKATGWLSIKFILGMAI